MYQATFKFNGVTDVIVTEAASYREAVAAFSTMLSRIGVNMIDTEVKSF